ncbi:MAG: sialidase family protein [Polyangiaceae bacterium]
MTNVRRASFSVFALLLAASTPARANGRFPSANMLVAQPNAPSHLALRATYGLLLSKDDGANWDWVCERALGYSGNEDPSVVIAGNGALVVGSFSGVVRSTDGGCHFDTDPSWPKSVVDLATRPTAPDRIYALTGAFAAMGDAGSTYTSKVWVSDDAGAHWAERGTLDPRYLVDTIEVAPSDPKRVYVSAVRTAGKTTEAAIFRSNDDGAHFEKHALALTGEERGLYIAAVAPKDANRIYLRTGGALEGRLLVSSDGGKTTKEVLRSDALRAFALSPDGTTLWTGGARDGLQRAATTDFHFEKTSATPLECLAAVGDRLWACTPAVIGSVLAVSTDRGASFTPRLTLDGMRGPLQCAGPSAMDECAADWSALRSVIAPRPPSMPTSTPSAAASSAPVVEKRSFFSCAFAPARKSSGFWLVFAAIAVIAGRRRARRRRHRHNKCVSPSASSPGITSRNHMP